MRVGSVKLPAVLMYGVVNYSIVVVSVYRSEFGAVRIAICDEEVLEYNIRRLPRAAVYYGEL